MSVWGRRERLWVRRDTRLGWVMLISRCSSDLTGRLFELTGTDAAAYDAYSTDPVSFQRSNARPLLTVGLAL
jgi:hypothetical protein